MNVKFYIYSHYHNGFYRYNPMFGDEYTGTLKATSFSSEEEAKQRLNGAFIASGIGNNDHLEIKQIYER